MSPIFTAILLLWSTCLVSITAQADTCFSSTLDAYVACAVDNYCTCGTCGVSDEIFNPSLPISCSDLNQYLCPLVRCCSVCSEAYQAYFKCTVIDTYIAQGVVTDGSCVLDCSSFPATDAVDPTCDDSTPTAPIGISSPTETPVQGPTSEANIPTPTETPVQGPSGGDSNNPPTADTSGARQVTAHIITILLAAPVMMLRLFA